MFEYENHQDCDLFCPLQEIAEIISKKWTLLVINETGNHKRIRFNELRSELRNITTKTLSATLLDLQKRGIIVKETFNETPTRIEYVLTNDGVGLYNIVKSLLQWACLRPVADVKGCSCKVLECNPKD